LRAFFMCIFILVVSSVKNQQLTILRFSAKLSF
jgi:hypothetical protein